MKRSRQNSSSDDSDNESNSTCWSHSSHHRRGTGQKPSEVFRTDFITAMKLHDSHPLNPEDYYVLADPWRQEWEKGVQVPVSPQSIPQPVARVLAEKGKEVMFVRPKKLIRTSGSEALGYVDIQTLAEGMCRYDLNEDDVAWLQIINGELAEMALPLLDEITMERVMEEFEHCCYENMTHAMETEEGLGIEYDEDVVCDVCRSPDGEDNNEMVFCDKCNICVHQACYGIQKVPKGSWLCRICALGIFPKCQLCPKKGGAMKPTRSGTKWVHVSCALWIPEVSIGNPEKMEPITNVSHIPSNRWSLICCLCKEKTGACIQCSAKNCRTAFHVTCGLHASLEMNTILTEEDEVKFKSYCPKHSGLEGTESLGRDSGDEQKGRRRSRARAEEDRGIPSLGHQSPSSQEEKRVNLRKLKLQEMEEEFFQFVKVEEVAGNLKLPPEVVDFLYQYWKLKRKANFNQPLLTPKKDEEESLARREQEVLLRRLQLFTHLRQDLERVRNLTYMVTRREKIKRSMWKVQEQIFQQQVHLLDQEMHSGNPSAEELEKFFSLDLFSLQSKSSSSLKSKRSSQKREKRNQADSCNSPENNQIKAPESKNLRIKDAVPMEASDVSDASQEAPRSEVVQEIAGLKPQKPESRKGGRRESLEQEAVLRREQDERGRKRRSDVMESLSCQVKNKFGSKHLEKTVSIRLVDIRNSDSDEYFIDESLSRRNSVSLDVTQSTKINLVRRTATPSSPGGSAAGHLKSWGKFRIPKRSEKPQEEEALLSLGSAPSYPRTRHRAGSHAFSPDSAPGEGELEPCLKRCHSHELRGDSALTRRYGSDIIRRGVLAS